VSPSLCRSFEGNRYFLNVCEGALEFVLLTPLYQESSGYLTPWLVAEFFRQLIFFVAFCFLAWFIGAAVYKDLVQDDIESKLYLTKLTRNLQIKS